MTCPSFHVRTLLDDAGPRRRRPGRDRALDEVVAVIAAMPDSITREELMREVADRLAADPGLVGGAAAEAGAARDLRRRARSVSRATPGPEAEERERAAPTAERRIRP